MTTTAQVPNITEVLKYAESQAASILRKYHFSDHRYSPEDVVSDVVVAWVKCGFMDESGDLVGYDASKSTVRGFTSMCLERAVLRKMRSSSDRLVRSCESFDEPLSDDGDDDNGLHDVICGISADGAVSELLLRELRERLVQLTGADLPDGDLEMVSVALSRMVEALGVDVLECRELPGLLSDMSNMSLGKLGFVSYSGQAYPATMLTAFRLLASTDQAEISKIFNIRPQSLSWRFRVLREKLSVLTTVPALA